MGPLSQRPSECSRGGGETYSTQLQAELDHSSQQSSQALSSHPACPWILHLAWHTFPPNPPHPSINYTAQRNKGNILTIRLTVQPIFLFSVSSPFMQSLKKQRNVTTHICKISFWRKKETKLSKQTQQTFLRAVLAAIWWLESTRYIHSSVWDSQNCPNSYYTSGLGSAKFWCGFLLCSALGLKYSAAYWNYIMKLLSVPELSVKMRICVSKLHW